MLSFAETVQLSDETVSSGRGSWVLFTAQDAVVAFRESPGHLVSGRDNIKGDFVNGAMTLVLMAMAPGLTYSLCVSCWVLSLCWLAPCRTPAADPCIGAQGSS